MKHQLIALMLGACSLAGAYAQTTNKLSATKANEYGLIYTLPLTTFEVTIAAEKTVRTPGEFYQYAKKYLNADPILASSKSSPRIWGTRAPCPSWAGSCRTPGSASICTK